MEHKEKEKESKPPVDSIEAAAGRLKGRIPPSDVLRAQARADEQRALKRRERQH